MARTGPSGDLRGLTSAFYRLHILSSRVYIEVPPTRVVLWPGVWVLWCRAGRFTESSCLVGRVNVPLSTPK